MPPTHTHINHRSGAYTLRLHTGCVVKSCEKESFLRTQHCYSVRLLTRIVATALCGAWVVACIWHLWPLPSPVSCMTSSACI